MLRLLTLSLLAGLFFCPSRMSADDKKTVDAKERFSKLGFLKGNWQSNVKLADATLTVSGLSFDTILDGQFFQLKYGITRSGKVETHQVIVGPGAKGTLKGWTFTSEGKSYESNIDVEATKNGCIVKAVTGKDTVIVKFTKTGDDTFTVEYENTARKIGPVTARFQKGP